VEETLELDRLIELFDRSHRVFWIEDKKILFCLFFKCIELGVHRNLVGKKLYSPFCEQAKVIKLVGLKNGGRLSPTNLITFACTQNGE
jgi:hypothetical protein